MVQRVAVLLLYKYGGYIEAARTPMNTGIALLLSSLRILVVKQQSE